MQVCGQCSGVCCGRRRLVKHLINLIVRHRCYTEKQGQQVRRQASQNCTAMIWLSVAADDVVKTPARRLQLFLQCLDVQLSKLLV